MCPLLARCGVLESQKGRVSLESLRQPRSFGVGVRAWAAEQAIPAPAVFHVEQASDWARERGDAVAAYRQTIPWRPSLSPHPAPAPLTLAGRTGLRTHQQTPCAPRRVLLPV